MRFGIIGTNFVSDFFMNGAQEVKECEVVAVCDIFEDKAKTFSKKHEIPYYFDDYEKMYEADLIDGVYIAVPNSIHFEIATFFLRKKIPTFCEKPLASNEKEVEELIRLAKEYKVYLQEGLIPLYNPNYKILKTKLSLVGKIQQVNLNFSKYSSRYDAYLKGENPTTFRKELSNGATMDLGVYLVAFCVGLFGLPKQILSAASLLDTGSDVAGSSIFKYDGFLVSLNYSKASDTSGVCEICGEKGQLLIDQASQPQQVIFKDRLGGTLQELGMKPQENFSYEISEMMQHLENGEIESSSVPFETTLAIHKVLTEMRRQSGIVFPKDE
ncbi:MAG: Gfo/Idh/MocA family protein [Breznakia sp.]